MGQPRPLFHLFLSFQTHITIFTTNRYVKKCPSNIWCQDSNSWPLAHESPPITTGPGLPNLDFALCILSSWIVHKLAESILCIELLIANQTLTKIKHLHWHHNCITIILYKRRIMFGWMMANLITALLGNVNCYANVIVV